MFKIYGGKIMAFLASFIKYLVTMIVILAIGLAGFFIGTSLRKNKNKKESANTTSTEQ